MLTLARLNNAASGSNYSHAYTLKILNLQDTQKQETNSPSYFWKIVIFSLSVIATVFLWVVLQTPNLETNTHRRLTEFEKHDKAWFMPVIKGDKPQLVTVKGKTKMGLNSMTYDIQFSSGKTTEAVPDSRLEKYIEVPKQPNVEWKCPTCETVNQRGHNKELDVVCKTLECEAWYCKSCDDVHEQYLCPAGHPSPLGRIEEQRGCFAMDTDDRDTLRPWKCQNKKCRHKDEIDPKAGACPKCGMGREVVRCMMCQDDISGLTLARFHPKKSKCCLTDHDVCVPCAERYIRTEINKIPKHNRNSKTNTFPCIICHKQDTLSKRDFRDLNQLYKDVEAEEAELTRELTPKERNLLAWNCSCGHKNKPYVRSPDDIYPCTSPSCVLDEKMEFPNVSDSE